MLVLALALLVELPVVDRPIPFDAERLALTIEYRRLHEDPAASDARIEPRVIVLHHTAAPTLAASLRAFEGARLPAARRELARGGALNVSAHFLVDRDGTISRLMPEDRMARHAIGLNHLAIGVENVGGTAGTPLTPAQVRANAALVRELVARFPGITHLIGHHELPAMRGHPYLRERMAGYATAKIDPGPAFMRAVRDELAPLRLAGPPSK